MILQTSKITKINHGHPVHGEPAFILESPLGVNGNVLIIADLHLGIEHSLAEAGANLPSQTERITKKIVDLCSNFEITQLVILGDIKHTVPSTSKQEWYELPKVFTNLTTVVDSIEIVPGNHDGNLDRIIPHNLSQVQFHPLAGTVLHGLGLFHGHTWPKAEVLEADQVLMAHNHPNVLFIDKLGGRASYSCWVRGRLDKERAIKRYPNIEDADPEIIIMPAFNDIGSGTPVNMAKHEFLGPMLKNQYIDIINANVYLLDGTDLGKIATLVELNKK